ncbi:efflux RND transporter periplasmic adaptor subunit [Ginsengibacter hankyongi]|uniref:Efflux RND transporter periplasmic adaptor subunit n=1 Tax=Ginsengibacter hankyongi TaxID=2607284 RepID=A0A5J5IFR0_9BACT|nr:efflux RND transporter periplasmic adaptor subunit [Ginsengibacter hankyongi]KAA9038464.1 efflux RND transporter periplasmic adaptor subunit [Ginsengibacter hankyongi]
MKKFKWLWWLLIIAAVGFAIWFWKFRSEESVIELQVEKPQYGNISNSVTATGTIQPVDTVTVGSQVSGTIKGVYADFNSTVKKGQLLAQIDPSLFEAQVQQITANLQSARANEVYQKSNYERQSKLYGVGAISKADLETALYGYNSAVSNVNGITAQLTSAKKNLSFTKIYSPIDGTVLSRNISEGQTVAASFNTPTLFSIAKDLTKMQVQASVDEADIGNVAKGQRAIFSVDAFPSDTFGGIVKEIRLRSSVSSNVVTYATIIDAPNDQMKLKPGMTANITIYTKELNNVLLISARALNFQPDSVLQKVYSIQGKLQENNAKRTRMKQVSKIEPSGGSNINADSAKTAFVWLKKDSSLVLHRIKTGMDDETQVQIISGLDINDEVVTGYIQEKKADLKNNTQKSPFMPQRPGRSNRRNSASPPPR